MNTYLRVRLEKKKIRTNTLCCELVQKLKAKEEKTIFHLKAKKFLFQITFN